MGEYRAAPHFNPTLSTNRPIFLLVKVRGSRRSPGQASVPTSKARGFVNSPQLDRVAAY
ncbi:hypothetical protein IMZ48_01095 [Candidatus Bathyarchaeota archaeon]|nr:hypothetical protein [Candidatus Bathyarchaeota archaeon]